MWIVIFISLTVIGGLIIFSLYYHSKQDSKVKSQGSQKRDNVSTLVKKPQSTEQISGKDEKAIQKDAVSGEKIQDAHGEVSRKPAGTQSDKAKTHDIHRNAGRGPEGERTPPTLPPEKTGGRRGHFAADEGDSTSPATKQRDDRPKIICWKSDWTWYVGVEIPKCWDVSCVHQNDDELRRHCNIDNLWKLKKLTGAISIPGHHEINLGNDDYLIFKLQGKELDHGERVKRVSAGTYLVIAPDSWMRDEEKAGPPPIRPEGVKLLGYKAHFFFLDSYYNDYQIAFLGHIVPQKTAPVFRLIGHQIQDDSERLGPLFSQEPPTVCIEDGLEKTVKTILCGEEGPGQGRWREIFRPRPNEDNQPLREKIKNTLSGWFFLRFYDQNDELIDSCDFRYIAGLQHIEKPDYPPLPPSNGHREVSVLLKHNEQCQLTVEKSSSDIGVTAEPTYDGTKLRIPPHSQSCLAQLLMKQDGGKEIEIEILIPRIWWALGEESAVPADWTDKPLELKREYFFAISTKTVWLQIPKPQWTRVLRFGFDASSSRECRIPSDKNILQLPLRNFGGASVLEQIGRHNFFVFHEDQNSIIGLLAIYCKCKFCQQTFNSYTIGLDHIDQTHQDAIMRPLTYEELRQRFPDRNFPRAIYKCPFCDKYIKNDDPLGAQTIICQHIANEHSDHRRPDGVIDIGWDMIADQETIRRHVIHDLPELYKCKMCDKECENSEEILMHYRQEHKNVVLPLQ